MAKEKGGGFIHEAVKKDKKDGNRTKLLIDIIRAVGYYVDLNELYSHRKPSSCIQKEDARDVIDDLIHIMKTKKDRRIMAPFTTLFHAF